MTKINKIRVSGTTYDLQDLNATKTVELTQAQYDALATKDPNTFYVITDASGGDLSNYYTKSETSGSSQISTALNAKQNTLVSGTNIKTINNESILGSGNIEVQGGGGSTYTAGRGISISNDVISFSLPISGGTGASSLIGNSNANQATSYYATAFGTSSNATGYYSFACGTGSTASGNISFACGEGTSARADDSFACGAFTRATGQRSFACGSLTSAATSSSFASGLRTLVTNIAEAGFGEYNNSVSGSTTWGNSGNVLMSVGNGSSESTRHNAFEIRQNGDIYIADTNDTSTSNFYEKPMIKLQDALSSGGGGSVTVDTALSSTSENPVQNKVIYAAIGNIESLLASI